MRYFPVLFALIGSFLFLGSEMAESARFLVAQHRTLESRTIFDRNDVRLAIYPNRRGFYNSRSIIPERVASFFIEKEDRFFYVHPGINPFSIMRSLWGTLFGTGGGGSSTITQQTAKILLGNENERTYANKAREALYAFALEFSLSKREILEMYLTSAYFGRNIQGVPEASYAYFNKTPAKLSDAEIASLLAVLSSPSRLPGTEANASASAVLGIERFGQVFPPLTPGMEQITRKTVTAFEAESLLPHCTGACRTTLDTALTEKLRGIMERNLESKSFSTAHNAALVVIKVPENELVAVIGSPNPSGEFPGAMINMAVQPRAIGSTIKPFIYAKAFEKGARPYTQVLDTEYQYSIGTGFSFYPKNYDGTYRGLVTLHEALANSLNIPSVKTLEFVGSRDFGEFLVNDLGLQPIQPIETYDLGIALGALEMDLLTLTHFFTVFPNQGDLNPLVVERGSSFALPMARRVQGVGVLSRPATQLITKILSDRSASSNQFGLAGNLHLRGGPYAVKTGTSRDYHDSWTIGYTPDFVVGVWVGNSDNTPMHDITGQTGAGKIWNEAMGLLLESLYKSSRGFSFDQVETIEVGGRLEYGLRGDTPRVHQAIFSKPTLITSIHSGEIFLRDEQSVVPLVARVPALWTIDGREIGFGVRKEWRPEKPGFYSISAKAGADSETVRVEVREE